MRRIRGKSNVDHNISFLCDLKQVRPNYPFDPPANGCCPRGTGFWVTDFPKVKFSASGKFPWIHQSEQKNYPLQFPKKVLLVNKNLRRLIQSREIETYQKVENTCCLRAESVLAPNWTAKPQQDFERFCECFSVFYNFT